MDRRIKMLLLWLNKQGIEVNCETKSYYIEKFDSIITSYILKFWYKGKRINKTTKEEEQYNYCKVVTPKNMMYTIKYLVAVKDNKVKAGESYEEEN